jgi:hypothetical protein
MNKKLLALLLILPVALFAADKVLGDNAPGGGKEKTRKKTDTQQTQVTAAPVAEAEPATTYATEQTNATTTVAPVDPETSAAERRTLLIAEISKLKAAFDQEGKEYERYNEARQTWLGDENISAETTDFLKKRVEAPFEAANLYGLDLEKSFSRCPSGYHITVMYANEEETEIGNEGYMVRDQGCWDRPVARFRFNVAKDEVAVILSENTTIDLNEFLKLYKKAS